MNTRFSILIDISGSMGNLEISGRRSLLPNGQTRIAYVQGFFNENILPAIYFADQITISTFCAVKEYDPFEEKDVFRPNVESLYEGPFHKHEITEQVQAIPEELDGGTPIAAALEQILTKLKDYPNDDRQVILITDGEENGGGDFREVIKRARQEDEIEFTIHFIGIAMDDKQAESARALVEYTGGTFVHIKEKNIESGKAERKIQKLVMALEEKTLHNLDEDYEDGGKIDFTEVDEEDDGGDPYDWSEDDDDEYETNSQDEEDIEVEEGQVSSKGREAYSSLERQIRRQDKTIKILVNRINHLTELIEALLEGRGSGSQPGFVPPVSEAWLRKIGRAAEQHVYQGLKKFYGERLVWNNKEDEFGLPYDFSISDEEGNPEWYLEVKGTIQQKKHPIFFMTKREWHFFLDHPYHYKVYLVQDPLKNPVVIKINYLQESLQQGRVVPYSHQPISIEADRVLLQYLVSEEEE